jgi:hypothetical protein
MIDPVLKFWLNPVWKYDWFWSGVWNNHLDIYNLYSFQHRILFRLHAYIYKILHFNNSPRNLSNQFIFNSALNKKYSLRTVQLFFQQICKWNNEIETDFDIFKSKIKTNINSLFLDFMVSFPNFPTFFLKSKTISLLRSSWNIYILTKLKRKIKKWILKKLNIKNLLIKKVYV